MKTETQYIFDEKEMKVIKECLVYTLHRLQKHGKPKNISEEAVDELVLSILDA